MAYYYAHVCLNIFKIYRRFDLKEVATELRISLVYDLSFNRKAKFVDKRLLFYPFIIQGEETFDFLQISCTCIRTERLWKMFIIFQFSTNFHVVKCKNLVFIRSVFMLRAVFSYTSSSKEFRTLLELVWKKKTLI